MPEDREFEPDDIENEQQISETLDKEISVVKPEYEQGIAETLKVAPYCFLSVVWTMWLNIAVNSNAIYCFLFCILGLLRNKCRL